MLVKIKAWPTKRRRRAMIRLADAARDDGQLLEAASLYEAAARRFPDFFGAWVQLGNMAKDNQDFARADDAYSRALALNPNDADLHLQRGHLAKLQGHLNEAIRCYGRSQELDPGGPATQELERVSRAQVAEAQGTVDLPTGAALFYQRLVLGYGRRYS